MRQNITAAPGYEETFSELAQKNLELEQARQELQAERRGRRAGELALIRRERQMGVLLYACQQLKGAMEAPAVLKALLQSAVELTGASSGSAALCNGAGGVVTESFEKGVYTGSRQSVTRGEGALGRALALRQVVVEYDCDFPPKTSAVAVPVQGNSGELLGLFELRFGPEGSRFTSDDISLLQGLACSAAVALEKAGMLSERHESRQASRAASSLLSATIDSTVDGIMAVDRHGEIVACNRRFAEMWGIGDEALDSGDSNKLLLSLLEQVRDPVQFFETVTRLYWQPERESYDLIELADGRCLERVSKPQYLEGEPAGRIWSFHDISELKRLEAQLLHVHKMEAIGTLTAGVAHEFNNILTAIIGYTELLSSTLAPPHPYNGFLGKISGAADRAVALVKNLLAYSRKEPVQTSKVECNALLRDLFVFLERLIGADIELRLKESDQLQGVLADRGQIEQVLVNLVGNARDAMPEGGELTLEVARVERTDACSGPGGSAKPGEYVRISVSDTGSGIDEATRNRIFEPFFTTKEVGKGTGLGLSISYGIVERHGGFIEVTSDKGRGATFALFLPRVELSAEPRSQRIRARTATSRLESILLVEENGAVRSLITQLLSAKGYRVIGAEDAEDGVEKFTSHREEIALVILDLATPKKNGADAYAGIRAVKNEVKTIFIGDHADDFMDSEQICEAPFNFLTTPILPEKLLSLVREVIGTPQVEGLPEVA